MLAPILQTGRTRYRKAKDCGSQGWCWDSTEGWTDSKAFSSLQEPGELWEGQGQRAEFR